MKLIRYIAVMQLKSCKNYCNFFVTKEFLSFVLFFYGRIILTNSLYNGCTTGLVFLKTCNRVTGQIPFYNRFYNVAATLPQPISYICNHGFRMLLGIALDSCVAFFFFEVVLLLKLFLSLYGH